LVRHGTACWHWVTANLTLSTLRAHWRSRNINAWDLVGCCRLTPGVLITLTAWLHSAAQRPTFHRYLYRRDVAIWLLIPRARCRLKTLPSSAAFTRSATGTFRNATGPPTRAAAAWLAITTARLPRCLTSATYYLYSPPYLEDFITVGPRRGTFPCIEDAVGTPCATYR